jgi:uncharacterized protein (DUF697 family)
MYQSEAPQSALEMGAMGETQGYVSGELESPLNEQQETALAQELLEITNEEELEEFLGNIFKGVAKAVGGVIRSPIGQALGGVLKNVAKTALPIVGGALGSFVAPGIGTALGSKLGSMASGLFELELEGLPQEVQEMEVARRFVRLSAASARQAAFAPPNVPPRYVAERAVTTVARRHAPGLLRGVPVLPLRTAAVDYGDDGSYGYDEPPSSGRPRAGRWVRRGRRYILLDT